MGSSKPVKFEHCDDCPSRDNGVFCGLEEQELNDLSRQKISNSFKRGQTLFVEGSPPYGLYCIAKGTIKVSKTGPDGKESIVRIAKGGDVLGHRGLLSGQNLRATATAMEDTAVCFVDKKYILKTLQDKPTVAMAMIEKLGRDLGEAEERLASMSQRNAFERTAELLLTLRSSHGTEVEPGRWHLGIRFTREEMAALVGTATETLIRCLSELKSEGALDQEGKELFIINVEKMLEFANIQD